MSGLVKVRCLGIGRCARAQRNRAFSTGEPQARFQTVAVVKDQIVCLPRFGGGDGVSVGQHELVSVG